MDVVGRVRRGEPRARPVAPPHHPYTAGRFAPDDFLIFGRETRGLPEALLAAHADRALVIPMRPEARSLNLATAVGIVLYEALRQTGGVREDGGWKMEDGRESSSR